MRYTHLSSFASIDVMGVPPVPILGQGKRFSSRLALLFILLGAPQFGMAQFVPGMSFSGSLLMAAGDASSANAPDSGLFAEGMRAVNEGRMKDAQSIFSRVASQKSAHADGALYWKAYTESETGQAKPALASCAALRKEYPSSRWVEECGALEIQIESWTGKRIEIRPTQSDDLKLLALNLMLKQDEPRALAEIQEILNGEGSDKLKKGVQLLMGHHYSDATYAQIVRISSVEGDVRIARGAESKEAEAKDADTSTWEKAVVDLPLETGFTLATGAGGRAEIELEDASTLYLDENSALTFNDLHTSSGVPYTEVALLTGTVSLDVRPYVAGESFVLKTPTDTYVTYYPHRAHSRITSYTDAIAITPQEGGVLKIPGVSQESLANGQTLYLREGKRVDAPPSADATDYTAWDKWVADRVAQRSTATAEVMKASGLSEPIPGLADLRGQGSFFDCAPYGTCWEPKKNPQLAAGQQEEPASPPGAGPMTQNKLKGSNARLQIVEDEEFFPCEPVALRYRFIRDPVTGKRRLIDTYMYANPVAYSWAVCHAGAWIHHNRHYVWVSGHKRHHVCPVRWVKSGKTTAFVPLHPYDVKGKPPINRKEVVFAINKKDGVSIERVKFDGKETISFLQEPPKEFRAAHLQPLFRAEEPRLAARALKDEPGNRGAVARTTAIPLHFDARAHNFMMERPVQQNGRSTTVPIPLSNHSGDLQSHAGSYSGAGSYRGDGGSHGGGNYSGSSSGHNGGSYSGGSSHGGGGNYGGGGGHSTGGTSSGGGGSHSSGGGNSSSSSSSASSSSSSSSSSSGASSSTTHH